MQYIPATDPDWYLVTFYQLIVCMWGGIGGWCGIDGGVGIGVGLMEGGVGVGRLELV